MSQLPPSSRPTLLSTYVREQQAHSNWCWAAVASSVSAYYARACRPWKQCCIASDCLVLSCCTNAGPCNQRHRLERALSVTGTLASHQPGPLPFNDIVTHIDNKTVVCCYVDWGDGTGHFVALVGYDALVRDVFIEDPFYGSSDEPYDTFVNAYNGSGKWHYTYLTH